MPRSVAYGVTVIVAGLLGTLPPMLLNRARTSHWFSKAVRTALSVGDVAPLMLIHVVPPSTDACHWTVGVGLPVAAAVKVAV
jgi:hypothetical protein